MALHEAQGSWILVGSMPCAGACDSCDAGADGGGGSGAAALLPATALGMSSGGSICGIRQVGHANSVRPGATERIMRQPAQRTRTLSAG